MGNSLCKRSWWFASPLFNQQREALYMTGFQNGQRQQLQEEAVSEYDAKQSLFLEAANSLSKMLEDKHKVNKTDQALLHALIEYFENTDATAHDLYEAFLREVPNGFFTATQRFIIASNLFFLSSDRRKPEIGVSQRKSGVTTLYVGEAADEIRGKQQKKGVLIRRLVFNLECDKEQLAESILRDHEAMQYFNSVKNDLFNEDQYRRQQRRDRKLAQLAKQHVHTRQTFQ